VEVDMAAMTRKFLQDAGINKSSPSPSNMDFFTSIDPADEDYSSNVDMFRRQVCSIMYLNRLRPDIIKETCHLATLVTNPGPIAIAKLRRLQEYLYGTIDKKMILGAKTKEIMLYADASYATHADSKSHTGSILCFGGSFIEAKSKKQKLVTTSSCEAELYALAEGVKATLGFAKVLLEIELIDHIQFKVLHDNRSTMTIAASGEGVTNKSKHFRVRYHFLKELQDDNILKIEWCPTNKMLADALTKPVTIKVMKKFCQPIFENKVLEHCLSKDDKGVSDAQQRDSKG